MVQKEVADKFIANCGDKEYSSLGVISELLCKNRSLVIDVPPESFSPPPKVNSSVIYLKKDLNNKLDDDFNKFLKFAFSQPRKKLIKNLSARYDKNILIKLFEDLKIKENIRPHELNASLYSQIYKQL